MIARLREVPLDITKVYSTMRRKKSFLLSVNTAISGLLGNDSLMKKAPSTKSDSASSLATHIGPLAALVGALSAATLFLALYGCWAFGRGMMRSLGFPISLLTMKNSVDLFPEVAFQYTLVFMLVLVAGFLIPTYFSRTVAYILLVLVFVIGFLALFEFSSPVFRLPLALAAMGGPLLIGYSFRVATDISSKLITVGVAIIAVFSVHSGNLYLFGKDKGNRILASREGSFAETGMAASKLSEYPLVQIFAPDRLPLGTPATPFEDGYLYSPQGQDFIRLVFTDADNYYLIENIANKPSSIAISKTSIRQLRFLSH